jgi:hypothetical protein
MQITTIGLDIAKNVFQVHGIDAAEKVVVRKRLRRGQVMKFFAALPPCLVGLEAISCHVGGVLAFCEPRQSGTKLSGRMLSKVSYTEVSHAYLPSIPCRTIPRLTAEMGPAAAARVECQRANRQFNAATRT